MPALLDEDDILFSVSLLRTGEGRGGDIAGARGIGGSGVSPGRIEVQSEERDAQRVLHDTYLTIFVPFFLSLLRFLLLSSLRLSVFA